jgi:hypothetical protein
MSGIQVFDSLEKAHSAGFAFFDRIPSGYLVRKDVGRHFALAIVELKTGKQRPAAHN